jgi:hypothetical protein
MTSAGRRRAGVFRASSGISTLPSGAIRSGTSRRQGRGTIVRGISRNRSYNSYCDRGQSPAVSAKAGHGDQLGRRALVPDQVGEQGRGMDHPINALRRDAGSLHDPPFGASGLDIRRVRHAVVGRGGQRLSFGAIQRGTRSLSQSLRCSNAWRALPTVAVSTGEARLAQALRT